MHNSTLLLFIKRKPEILVPTYIYRYTKSEFYDYNGHFYSSGLIRSNSSSHEFITAALHFSFVADGKLFSVECSANSSAFMYGVLKSPLTHPI